MDITASQSVKWHIHLLPKATQKALEYLSQLGWLKSTSWYLAGGTALSFQVGHRQSVDLDFFTPDKEFSAVSLVKHFSDDIWQTDILREGTIYGKLHQAKVSFIAYPFFLPKQPFQWYGAVPILDLRDIAVMKIIAISQRGRKRDFVDLFWHCQHRERLLDIFLRLANQYPTVNHNYHHIIKSLTYFVDAESDPMPKLFFKASWRQIKFFFQREAVRIAKEMLGLK